MNEKPINSDHPKSAAFIWIFGGTILALCLFFSITTSFAVSMILIQSRQSSVATQTRAAYSLNATATHVAAVAERAGFEFFDQFNDNKNGWLIGENDDAYFIGHNKVEQGVYVWNIEETKLGFAGWGTKRSGRLNLTDFDAYVDTKLVQGSPSGICYGLQFRASIIRQSDSYYTYEICNNGYFRVNYHEGKAADWETLIDWTRSEAIHSNQWNTIGVSARGTHFVYTINDSKVAELDDNRLDTGNVSVFIDIESGEAGTIWFDNFALQSR
jgi:hypothetical protein